MPYTLSPDSCQPGTLVRQTGPLDGWTCLTRHYPTSAADNHAPPRLAAAACSCCHNCCQSDAALLQLLLMLPPLPGLLYLLAVSWPSGRTPAAGAYGCANANSERVGEPIVKSHPHEPLQYGVDGGSRDGIAYWICLSPLTMAAA